MKSITSLRQFFLVVVTMMGMLILSTAQSQEGKTYIELNKTQPSETVGKVEVIEFFAYTCPHCKAMEPLISDWSKTIPEDVALMRVPVAFNANLTDLQKLYFTLDNLERLDLHPKVFQALHNEGKSLYKADEIIEWAEEQGLDRQVFSDIFNSFGIQSRVSRANELVKNYNIESTPSLAIGGKYVTSPGMTNSYEATITEADKLIEKARERGQP